MWARIKDGVVAEITDIDPDGRFHPSIEWVEFDGRKTVTEGWLYSSGNFTKPDTTPSYTAYLFTYKRDIWQRVTDEEAAIIDQSLVSAPVKQRRMWDDAQSIEHSSEYFSALKSQMVDAFGAERADEILAPSGT